MHVIVNNQAWKPVPFAPDYEVSEFGLVRRLTGNARTWKGRILSAKGRHKFGYPVIYVMIPDKKRAWPCERHKLVAAAFLEPKPFPEAELAHKDGDVLSNHWKNLAWKTHKENIADQRLHGTTSKGARNGAAKLTAQDVLNIRRFCKIDSQDAAAKRFGVSFQQISRIMKGQRWGWLQ